MKTVIEKMNIKVDLELLRETVLGFLDRYHWEKSNQLCLLNTQDHTPGDPYQGIGHVNEPTYGAFGYKETDFNVFHPDYRNTILGEIYYSFPHPVCRMRLLRVPAKRCYTFHSDGPTYRYHVAVISNENAFFVYKELERIFFVPPDGHFYKVDVNPPHTFVNTNSDFDRIHLVLDASPNE